MRQGLAHPIGAVRQRRGRRRPAAVATHQPARLRTADPALARAREAGGPLDRASYSCQCGYQFSADVSTTVACPHCGCEQAW